MKGRILKEQFPTEARQVGATLVASLEEMIKLDAEERNRTDIVNDLVQLGLKIRRDFPEDKSLNDAVSETLKLANMGSDIELPSMEGLGSVFSKLGSLWKKHKPDAKHITSEEESEWKVLYQAIQKFVTEMESTYLQSSWLDKQTFIEGSVKANDISGAFCIDGKPATDPLKNFETVQGRVSSFIRAWQPIVTNTDNKVRALHQEALKATRGLKEFDSDTINLLKTIVDKFDTMEDPLKHLPKFQGTSFENSVLRAEGNFLIVDRVSDVVTLDTLPALEKSSILKAASIVKALIKWNWLPEFNGGNWLDFEVDEEFTDNFDSSNEKLYLRYYNRFYHDRARERYSYAVDDIVDTYKLAISLIKWIDRSIK